MRALLVSFVLAACGGRVPEPRTAARVRELPLLALLPQGVFGVLRIDLDAVPASTEPSRDPNKKPFEVSAELTEAIVGFVEGPEVRSVVLLRGDLDRADLRREIDAGMDFFPSDHPPRWRRHRGVRVVDLVDQSIYDLGAGTWLWTGDAELADEVLDIATGRRPPSTLAPHVREVADAAHLEESAFALALVATDGLRDGIREIGDAFGTDAGGRLGTALESVAVSVRESDPFLWEVVVESTGPEGAREIAAIATDAGALASALLASIGLDLGQMHPRVTIEGGRFLLSGTMNEWVNRFEWSRPTTATEPPRNPNVL